MHKFVGLFVLCFSLCLGCRPAAADFVVSSAIIEFNKDTPTTQDIDLVSRSKDSDYIVTEISEIQHAGLPDEKRQMIEDPSQGALLVTPDKTILAGGGRKVLRFVLLKDLDDQEHIYRVKVQPVIKGVNTDHARVGLKILVGYEVLVIVRPRDIQPNYTATRSGKVFKVVNNGNSNILFQAGKQCLTPDNCKLAPVLRVYPGEQTQVDLPIDGNVTYSVWDGVDSNEKHY